MVETADTATYELLKWAIFKNFTELNKKPGTAEITNIYDSSGNAIVQTSVRVTSNDGGSYTINLYNTTSKFLINGKNSNDFINRDNKEVHKLASSAINSESTLHSLNKLLAKQLAGVLENLVDEHHCTKVSLQKEIQTV
jgi:hypothetical protein